MPPPTTPDPIPAPPPLPNQEPCALTDFSCLWANPGDPNSPLNPANPASPMYNQNHDQDGDSNPPGDDQGGSNAPGGGLGGLLPSLSG
ncbi:hypothetical protein [Nocardia sp. NPDC020380]|uniref:hypothetical protein n=1 Tax=Nocardia sp. NPDC020380 TaxID=3364309 RepID=UPI0037B0A18C